MSRFADLRTNEVHLIAEEESVPPFPAQQRWLVVHPENIWQSLRWDMKHAWHQKRLLNTKSRFDSPVERPSSCGHFVCFIFLFRRHPEKTQGMRLGPKLTWKKSKKRGDCQVDHKATRQPSCPKIMNDHTLQQTKPVMTFWAGKLMKIIYQEGVFQSLPRRVEASKGKMIITIQPIQSIHIPHMLLGWTRNLQLRVRHVTTANFGQGI